MCLFVFTEIVNWILFGYDFGVYTVDFVFFHTILEYTQWTLFFPLLCPCDRDFSFGSSFWDHVLLNNIYTTHSTVVSIFVVEVHGVGYIHDTLYSLRCVRCGSA